MLFPCKKEVSIFSKNVFTLFLFFSHPNPSLSGKEIAKEEYPPHIPVVKTKDSSVIYFTTLNAFNLVLCTLNTVFKGQ